MLVDLLVFGNRDVPWALGDIRRLSRAPAKTGPALDEWLGTTRAEYGFFWDSELGAPDPEVVLDTIGTPGDVWHAGLRLGTAGLPHLIDCVEPVWLMNRDPEPDVVATSWRISLRACLVKVEVLRQLGAIDSAFDTFTAAGLDFGCRLLRRGAIVRHVPALGGDNTGAAGAISLRDELRFIRQHYGARWLAWTLFRAVLLGYPVVQLLRGAAHVRAMGVRRLPRPYDRGGIGDESFTISDWHGTVSVLVPTLERYSYLRNELAQLRHQTVRPKEIIVVDQTPEPKRDRTVAEDFPDLPLRVFYQDTLGQCTAWNHALKSATGDFVLFLGDDADEIRSDFIEKFLRTCEGLKADMVAAAVDEVGAGPLPESLTFLRVSDIFPIAMVRRSFFKKTGLYDYAFDRGARADADVAMRWYLSGALMIFDPAIRVLHLKAPRGGLRAHGARVITVASSRQRLTHRDVPSTTEMYLLTRHYSHRQVREMIWQRVAATFMCRGDRVRQIVKAVLAVLYLPHTIWKTRHNLGRARLMHRQFPQIPEL